MVPHVDCASEDARNSSAGKVQRDEVARRRCETKSVAARVHVVDENRHLASDYRKLVDVGILKRRGGKKGEEKRARLWTYKERISCCGLRISAGKIDLTTTDSGLTSSRTCRRVDDLGVGPKESVGVAPGVNHTGREGGASALNDNLVLRNGACQCWSE